ncbi:hypothetical protein BDZ97DRAFT_94506 [Flammula alnicola]|nr:hypothetical protein BDZ97DRAFT_94506 [Flammula alnicola]
MPERPNRYPDAYDRPSPEEMGQSSRTCSSQNPTGLYTDLNFFLSSYVAHPRFGFVLSEQTVNDNLCHLKRRPFYRRRPRLVQCTETLLHMFPLLCRKNLSHLAGQIATPVFLGARGLHPMPPTPPTPKHAHQWTECLRALSAQPGKTTTTRIMHPNSLIMAGIIILSLFLKSILAWKLTLATLQIQVSTVSEGYKERPSASRRHGRFTGGPRSSRPVQTAPQGQAYSTRATSSPTEPLQKGPENARYDNASSAGLPPRPDEKRNNDDYRDSRSGWGDSRPGNMHPERIPPVCALIISFEHYLIEF